MCYSHVAHRPESTPCPGGSGSCGSCSCTESSRRSPPRLTKTIAPLAPSLCHPSRSSAARPSAKLVRRSLPAGSSVESSTLWNMSRSTSQRESRDVARGSYLLRLAVMARTLSSDVRARPFSSVRGSRLYELRVAAKERVPSYCHHNKRGRVLTRPLCGSQCRIQRCLLPHVQIRVGQSGGLLHESTASVFTSAQAARSRLGLILG